MVVAYLVLTVAKNEWPPLAAFGKLDCFNFFLQKIEVAY